MYLRKGLPWWIFLYLIFLKNPSIAQICLKEKNKFSLRLEPNNELFEVDAQSGQSLREIWRLIHYLSLQLAAELQLDLMCFWTSLPSS